MSFTEEFRTQDEAPSGCSAPRDPTRTSSQNVRKKGEVAGSFANSVETSCVVRASVSSAKTYLLLKVTASTWDELVVREAPSL
jgi:hypothetical protein